MNGDAGPHNWFEHELRRLVRVSLGLFAVPVLALGIALLVVGLHEGRAPNIVAMGAGVDLTYYVNPSRVVAGGATTLAGLTLVYAAVRPQLRLRR